MLPTAPHGSLSACARALALILLAIIAAGSSLAQEVTPLEAARALITDKQYEAAIEAVAPALESDDPTTVREAKLIVADCQRLLTRYDEAIASYTVLVDEGTQDQTLVSALTGLADCLIRTGKLDEADAAIARALALYPEITDAAYAARGSSFYSRNVVQYYSAVEFARGQLTRLASGYASAGNPAAALLTYRKLYHEYADHRHAPDIAIKVGDLLREQGSHEWAVPFYLAALDTGGDRCYSREAKVSVNQVWLNAVSQPPPQTRTVSALAGLNACLTELAPEQALGEAALVRFGERWREALAQTYEPFSAGGRERWRSLAEAVEKEPWRSLCLLAMAQSFIRDAYYEEALAVADEARPDGPAARALGQRLGLERARAHLGLRTLDEAARHAEWVIGGVDRVVASEAMLVRARALEAAPNLGAARRAYTIAGQQSVVGWHRRLGEYALKRVHELGQNPIARKTGVSVLPDDRTTRGDWPIGYGRAYHVLCAQNYVLDRTGGAVEKVNCAFSTTDPNERGRLWVSTRSEEDPSFLWDYARRCFMASNRDDFGEQYPIGAGPDLLLSIHVPDGAQVLSLYFVNDHNYYEPNRSYTISIVDAEGRLLALSDVEDFGGGVYKRFAVAGGRELRLRLWRNLSLNVIFAGVFLDVIEPPTYAPHEGNLVTLPDLDPLPPEYAALRDRFLAEPVAALRNTSGIGRVRATVAQLREVTPAGCTSLHLQWMISECLRLRGRHRQAEVAFDDYLAEVAEAYAGEEMLAKYEWIAQILLRRPGRGFPTMHENTHRRRMREPVHRWDRAWDAYFAALAEYWREQPERHQEALVAAMRDRPGHYPEIGPPKAADLLHEHYPQALRDRGNLSIAMSIYRGANLDEHGLSLAHDILATETDEELRRIVIRPLASLYANAHHPGEQVEAAHRQIVEVFGQDSDEARRALSTVAMAYSNDKEFERAIEVAKEYMSRFGESAWLTSLIERCTERLKTAGGEEQ